MKMKNTQFVVTKSRPFMLIVCQKFLFAQIVFNQKHRKKKQIESTLFYFVSALYPKTGNAILLRSYVFLQIIVELFFTRKGKKKSS